jgi:hypothetical protein
VFHRASRRVRRKNYAFVTDAFAFTQKGEYNECRNYNRLQNDRDDQSAPAYFAVAPLLLRITFDETAFQ